MFEVTKPALKNVKDYLRQQKIDSAIRIAMTSSGCGGPSLGLAQDEAKDNDKIFENDGVRFVVDRALAEISGTIKVDFVEETDGGCGCGGGGFVVTCVNPLSGSGCGCSCSTGACG